MRVKQDGREKSPATTIKPKQLKLRNGKLSGEGREGRATIKGMRNKGKKKGSYNFRVRTQKRAFGYEKTARKKKYVWYF